MMMMMIMIMMMMIIIIIIIITRKLATNIALCLHFLTYFVTVFVTFSFPLYLLLSGRTSIHYMGNKN